MEQQSLDLSQSAFSLTLAGDTSLKLVAGMPAQLKNQHSGQNGIDRARVERAKRIALAILPH